MALSYCNWPENNSGAVTAYSHLFRPPSAVPEMFSFHEEPTFFDTGINPLFDQSYFNYPNNILAPTGVAGDVFTPSPEFQVSSFTYQDPYYRLPYPTTFNQDQNFPAEYGMQPPPEMGRGTCHGGCVALPAWYGCGGGMNGNGNGYGEVEVKRGNGGNGGGSLSAQSMAARVRRRRISEKTQELGKLVPGGHKMNTAEMFQAAFKYIKFLQAQIGVLKLMPSLPESEEVMSNGEMQALVTCTIMQEKLYTAEKCIGPSTLKKLS